MQSLSNRDDIEIFENVDIGAYTTLKAKIIGDMAIAKSTDAIMEVKTWAKTNNKKIRVIGWGSNQVLTNSTDTIFLKLKFDDESDLTRELKEYQVSASLNLNKLSACAMKFSIAGWDVFTGIPATVGGAIFMNAGTKLGEFGEIVKNVRILRKDNTEELYEVNDKSFSYRTNHFLNDGDIILSATLDASKKDPKMKEKIRSYLELRNKTQPLGTKNCGCVFKNSPTLLAGEAIDKLGLKGFEYKGFKVSEKHANFIENCGDGLHEDFVALTKLLQERLYDEYGIKFELEVKIY